MKLLAIFALIIILSTNTSIIYSQHSNRLFYGGYDGSTRINLMDKYDKGDCNTYLGVDLFSQPSDAKLFYHKLSDGSYYKGAVISDKDWNRLIVGLLKYDSNGNQISNAEKIWAVGSNGYGSSNYKGPEAVAVTYYSPGEVCLYVADKVNNRIQRCVLNLATGAIRLWSALATGKFNYPTDVEVDNKNDLIPSNDELWVADSRNNRIARMSYTGSLIDSYGTIKSGTEGTAGNIKNPKSLTLYRMMDEVYSHTIVVSDNGNNRLVLLDYDGNTFSQVDELPISQPSFITCVQFDQTSNCVYAVDEYNSKIYKYSYRGTSGTNDHLFLCGEYGGYGTGNYQLKHPVSIHPIVPLETSPGSNSYFGANYVGILEEWSANSGFQIGKEGVDILDMQVTVPSGQQKVDYKYKVPSGIGYIIETIKSGTEDLISKLDELWPYESRNDSWFGNMNGYYLDPGTYTLGTKITSYWDKDDSKTLQNNFYINPGGPFATVPYSTSFGSSLDGYWDKSFSLLNNVTTTNIYGPHSGSYHLLMTAFFDPTLIFNFIPLSGNNYANLKLRFPNSGSQTELTFWWKDIGDINHSDDAIYFSDDAGNNWSKVYQFYPQSNPDNVWNKITLDVDQLCQSNGLTQSNRFKIKFAQHNDWTASMIAIDDVAVTIKTGGELKSGKMKIEELDEKDTKPIITDSDYQKYELTNYPNPFSYKTTINYTLAEDSKVMLEILDMAGRNVVTLVNTGQTKGNKNIYWDGTNNTGQKVPAGIYFCRLYLFNNINPGHLISRPLLKAE